MASLIRDKKTGCKTIQLNDRESSGKRPKISLGKIPVRDAQLFLSRIQGIIATNRSQRSLDADLADWVAKLEDALADRLAALGLIPARERRVMPNLKAFTDDYIGKRHDAKPRTIVIFRQAQRSLLEFFGSSRPLDGITQGEMEDWQRWMVGKGLAENTHRKRAAITKQFFNSALRHKIVRENPCVTLKCRLIVVEERQRLISLETIHQVLEFCDPEMRALVCLSRFTALRCPSESVQLRWSDVDRIKRTFVVRSPKTEGYGKGHRLVPLVPEVEQALEVLWERVPEGGSDLVFARYAACAGVGAILRKQLVRAFNRAGLDLPPKPWHNMRATCVNEWSELYPSHVVCDWAGHSEAVSHKHYRVTTDAHFQKAVSQPLRTEATVQNRVQQAAATSGFDSQAAIGHDVEAPDLLGIANRDEMSQIADCTRRDSNPQPTVPKTVALSN